MPLSRRELILKRGLSLGVYGLANDLSASVRIGKGTLLTALLFPLMGIGIIGAFFSNREYARYFRFPERASPM
jgi:hypothetical protein